MVKFSLALALLFASRSFSLCQSIQKDTLISAIQNTKIIYSQAMKGQSQLYNGSDYVKYQPLEDEHPYFISNDWKVGSIQYDEQVYENVGLLYNIFTDQVIIEYYRSETPLELVKERVRSFTIDGHTFIQLRENNLPNGFYERLSDGNAKVYVKRSKGFQEKTPSSGKIERTFDEKSKYYILKDGIYHAVKSKSSLIKIFDTRKKEIKQFLNKNRLVFGKNKEKVIIRTVVFYNQM
jgi:hypothetical protein